MRTTKAFIFSAFLILCSFCVSAAELNYQGTFTVMKGDQVLTFEEVTYTITLDEATKKAQFVTVGMRFGSRMPGGLTIDFGDVPYTQEGENYLFETELTRPTNEGKPFGKSTIRNFYCSTTPKEINAVFEAGSVMAQFEGVVKE